MDPNANKVWEKPQLIILARSKPEEAVLTACKTDATAGGNASQNAGCYSATACDARCEGFDGS
jgi:hypothetical protein